MLTQTSWRKPCWLTGALLWPLWNWPVRMLRAAKSVAVSRVAETSRIIASSNTPNSSIISGMAMRANSTAVAPRRERTNRRMTVRSWVAERGMASPGSVTAGD